MADIELTIKMPEEIYNRYMNYTENFVDFMFCGSEEKIVRAIRNGVILPKGHGDLIDSSYEVSTDGRTIYDVCGYLAPTIIEADKESEEE